MKPATVCVATLVALGALGRDRPGAGARRRRRVREGVRELPPESGRRFARAQPRGARARSRRRRSSRRSISGNMFRQGSALTDAERRAVAGLHRRAARGHRRAAADAGPLHAPRRRRCARGICRRLERVGRRRRQHPLRAGRGRRRHRADDAAHEAEVGVRVRGRQLGAIAAGRRSVGACSSAARAATCSRSTRRPAAPTGAITRRRASARRSRWRPTSRRTGPSGFAVFFADGTASAYAVDAATGKEIWTRKLDSHPYAKATGSVTVHDGRVYVPLAGVGEEGQGGAAKYECCTFRGSVTALNANTGAVIWKTYTDATSRSRAARTRKACALWGPAGGGIWAAPTVDREAQGACTSPRATATREPPQLTTDAVLALDIEHAASCGGRSSRWPTTCGPAGAAPNDTRQPELPGSSSVPTTTSRRRRCS